MKLKRLGDAHRRSLPSCAGAAGCPDVFELDDGDFAIIGADITAEAIPDLPQGSGCAPDERVVRVPRAVLIAAWAEIPSRA